MARSVAWARDCLVSGLMLVMRLGALVIRRSPMMIRLWPGVKVLGVIAMMVFTMAIGL